MKPTLLLTKIILLALSLTASTAFAQMKGGIKQMRLWAGPQVGLNVSNFYTDSATLYNQYRVGFLGGASVNFSFHKNFAVQTEINYSPKGGKYRFNTDTSTIRASYGFTYLDVPLLFMVKGGEGDSPVFFQVGGQYSFLLNAEYSQEQTIGATASSLTNTNVDSLGVPTSELGFMAGFGMISTSGWSFTLRAGFGAKDIPDRYNKVIVRNMVFQTSLCYYFGRKHDVIGGRRK